MFGFWEILIILIILGTVIWPWWQRRLAQKRPVQPTDPPPAREVDYEDPSPDTHQDPS